MLKLMVLSIVLLLGLGISSQISAQQRTVQGTVTDNQGSPLPGVTVVIKGTTQGTVTNATGEYSLTSPSDATLVFSFVGMKTQEILIENRATIDVILEQDIIGLEEVIAIGYGTVRKSDLTGSVERVSSSDFETKSITNMIEALTGSVPGFYSTQGTLAAGGGSMEIRGPTSLAANIEPLIVLDGVIYSGNLRDINPEDIESMDILKDASAAAIFGSRSASGVIVVTTKKGKISRPTINLYLKTGIAGLTNHMTPLSPMDYLEARGDYFRRIHSDARPQYYYTHPNDLPNNISLEDWAAYDASPSPDYEGTWLSRLVLSPKERENYLAGRTLNWYDEIVRNGIRQDYDMNVIGGSEKLRYFFSTGYVHNEGVTLGDEFKAFRSRVNLDADLYDFLKVGVNAQFGDRDQGFERINIEDAVRQSPWTQIYDDDGNLIMYPNDDTLLQNPFNYYFHRQRYNKVQSLFATLFGELIFPFGFSYRINYSNNFYFVKDYLFDPLETPRGLSNNGYGYRTNSSNYNWMIDNIIKWNRIIADIHRFDLTFLINAEKNQSWSDQQINSGMQPTGALGFHGLQAGTNPQLINNDIYSTGNALMARLNYILMNKYFLTMAWRRDGYSAFGQSNPYAQFPSGAFAWTISEEDFFKLNWINNLKIRISWGINGNRDIGPYDALARLSSSSYLYGNNLAIGVFSSSMANTNLKMGADGSCKPWD
jgi:TonB-dependent starch-binding outer membrane protein SusC